MKNENAIDENEDKAQTLAKIKSGEYILAYLN